MSSIVQSIQKKSFLPKSNSLPVSQGEQQPSLRRRLSSLSLKIQPISSQTTSWAFQRSKSVSAMGEYAGTSVRKWWDWGWTWILSKKPSFAQDLEMNEEETRVLGCQNKGSLRHVFYKVRSEIKKLMGSDKVGLPQTCKYSSFDYSKNFQG
ncbi:Protein downstream neighbor of son like [Melia azedarach]|uniref:Protein downstream neighbor of son like n=1 Tax=Melia azedarach TaxID=155640 RepID=A0ACC1XYL4_MELAZ|nr:Protein downstream neighbor of son like [Melia azedarach]